MCILEQEVIVGGISSDVIEICEITDENPFELRAITATIARLAWFAKNAVCVHEIEDGCIRNQCCLVDIRNIARDLVEVRQSAENDALIVCPGCVAVIYAAVKAIVDEILTINHPARFEPNPFISRPIEI